MPEKLLGKETESSLGNFCEVAKEYGATGIEFERHPDGTEVLKQKLGEGWHGLGYDGKNLWLGLTPAGEQYDWNANTILEEGKEYKGIVKGGGLDGHHPVGALFASLRERFGEEVEVHVTGEHASWTLNEKTKLEPDWDEDGNLFSLVGGRGNVPVGSQIKAVITNVEINWDDAAWRVGQEQKLTIKPESKWDLG